MRRRSGSGTPRVGSARSKPRSTVPASVSLESRGNAQKAAASEEYSAQLLDRINALHKTISQRLDGAALDIDPSCKDRYADVERQRQEALRASNAYNPLANLLSSLSSWGSGGGGGGSPVPPGSRQKPSSRGSTRAGGPKRPATAAGGLDELPPGMAEEELVTEQPAGGGGLDSPPPVAPAPPGAPDATGMGEEPDAGAGGGDMHSPQPGSVPPVAGGGDGDDALTAGGGSPPDTRAGGFRAAGGGAADKRPHAVRGGAAAVRRAEAANEMAQRRRREAKKLEARLKLVAAESMSRFVDSIAFDPHATVQVVNPPVPLAAQYTAARIQPKYAAARFSEAFLQENTYSIILQCFWLVHTKLFNDRAHFVMEVLLQTLARSYVVLLTTEVPNRYAFAETLPFAVCDAIYALFYYYVAGSRPLYTRKFQFDTQLLISRVLSGIELAPITVLLQQERLFPDDIPFAADELTSGRASSIVSSQSIASIERRATKASAARREAAIAHAHKVGSEPASASPPAHAAASGVASATQGSAVLESKEIMSITKTLGFRSVYDLFKTTTDEDRDVLGLHDAFTAEMVRSVEKMSLLPSNALSAARQVEEMRAATSAKRRSPSPPRSPTAGEAPTAASRMFSPVRTSASTSSLAAPSHAAAAMRSPLPAGGGAAGAMALRSSASSTLLASPMVTRVKPGDKYEPVYAGPPDFVAEAVATMRTRATLRAAGGASVSGGSPSASPSPATRANAAHTSSMPTLPSHKAGNGTTTGLASHGSFFLPPAGAAPSSPRSHASDAESHSSVATSRARLSRLPGIAEPEEPVSDELITRLLVKRSKRRPLSIPFVHTDTSTLMSRALVDSDVSKSLGRLAVKRTVPVPWSRVGGVDTFVSHGRSSAEREAVTQAQTRIQETVRALHNESHRLHMATVREMEAKRDEVLAAGPVKVARASLEVRQERMRRLQQRAAATQSKTLSRQSESLLGDLDEGSDDDEGEEGDMDDAALIGVEARLGLSAAPPDAMARHATHIPAPSKLMGARA